MRPNANVMRLAAAAGGYVEGRRGLLARGRSRHRHSPQLLFAKMACGGAFLAPRRN